MDAATITEIEAEPVLAPDEQDQLQRLEHVVESGLRTFIEVGEALSAIRDRRLYRGTHGTFEDYCVERWGMKKAYANHLVRAAETVRALPTEMATIVATESQARELAKVPPLSARP